VLNRYILKNVNLLRVAVASCAGCLTLNAVVRAADTSPASVSLLGNPYGLVAVRNVFGLVPPPTIPSCVPIAPPRITVLGIYSAFGHPRVLFEGSFRPGEPAKDRFYNLGEGQIEDEVEVVRIDESKFVVTFVNQGFDQDVPLTLAPK